MKIEFRAEPLSQLTTPTLVAYSFEDAPASSGSVERLPEETRQQLGELQASGELTGKPFEFTVLRKPAGSGAAKLLVVGAGKREKFSVETLRKLAGATARQLRSRGGKDFAWLLDPADEAAIAAVVEGVLVADYDADVYRTDRSPDKRIDTLLLATAGESISAGGQAALDRGRILGDAQNFTRELVNEPSNVMTPKKLAERATEMAKRFSLECEVLGPEEIQRLKMGAFWGVAQGSQTEPARFIVLRYAPADTPETPIIGLIGKGITFDSGGISIKPSENMHEMKTDMAGGATMLGVMQAIAQLKPNVRVTALIPATENMPRRECFQAGGRSHVHVGQDDRDSEYRRRGPIDSRRRADLCQAARLHGFDRRCDFDRGLHGCTWKHHHGSIWLEQGMGESRPGGCGRGGREDVGITRGRRLSRPLQKRDCGSGEHGRALRRRHHRGNVHRGVRRRYALGSLRHRRHAMVQ